MQSVQKGIQLAYTEGTANHDKVQLQHLCCAPLACWALCASSESLLQCCRDGCSPLCICINKPDRLAPTSAQHLAQCDYNCSPGMKLNPGVTVLRRDLGSCMKALLHQHFVPAEHHPVKHDLQVHARAILLHSATLSSLAEALQGTLLPSVSHKSVLELACDLGIA